MADSRNSSVAAIKRHRTARLASLATRAYYLHRRGRDERMYDLIAEEFVTLGGVYIKFLQGVMLQSQVMRRWHNPDRLKVFENLDHEPLDIVAILQKELRPEQLAHITLIQPQPFAAGSFGQVYYGQLDGNRPIIVKVLRPMVRELLRYDLRLLSMFSKSLASKFSSNVELNLDSAIRDFRIATLHETDYIGEAAFARQLFEAYKNHSKLVIPETFIELSTPNIIVQEYVNGVSVAQLIRLQEQGVDPATYVREVLGSDLDNQLETLGIEALCGVFDLPRIQGDPHPGNIRLMTEDRVGMIDFGIAAPTPKNKAAFYGLIEEWNRLYKDDHDIVNLFEQFMRFFVSDLYRALQRLGSMGSQRTKATGASASSDNPNNYTKAIGRIAQESFTKIVGTNDLKPLLENGKVLQIINQMINKDNRFGLVLHLESSEILRAAQTYMTLVESLGRRAEVLPRVFDKVVKRIEQDHPDLKHQGDESMSVSDALETVSLWLERVATRDPALFRQLVNRIRISKVTPKAGAKKKAPAKVELEKNDA